MIEIKALSIEIFHLDIEFRMLRVVGLQGIEDNF